MVARVSFVYRFRLLGVVLALLCTLATTPVRADQEPILLEYSADPGCPSGADFERMVFERAHSARPALDQEAARLFTVTIRKTAQGVQGSLTVREAGVNLVRQVRGKSCRQLASVLALAAALAIDPAADLAPAREGENDEPDAATSPEFDEPSVQTPSSATSEGATTTVAPNSPAYEARPSFIAPEDSGSGVDEPSAPSVLYGELGIGPRFELGATPYPALGPHVTVGLLSANGRWRAQLGGSWLLTPDKQVGPAAAEFRLLTANLSLCALALQWREHVTGGPCIHAELGDLYGRGLDIDYRTTVHRVWSTAGAHIHVRIPRDDAWFFSADIGANVLFNRYAFEFNEPRTEVYTQLPITGSVNILVGKLF